MSKEFRDIKSTIECGFTLEHVRDMIGTYSRVEATLAYNCDRNNILATKTSQISTMFYGEQNHKQNLEPY